MAPSPRTWAAAAPWPQRRQRWGSESRGSGCAEPGRGRRPVGSAHPDDDLLTLEAAVSRGRPLTRAPERRRRAASASAATMGAASTRYPGPPRTTAASSGSMATVASRR